MGSCVRARARAAMPGDDLLFHRLGDSTIGAVRFHGRVRDGIGCSPLATATRPSKAAGCVVGRCGWVDVSGLRLVRGLAAARDEEKQDQARSRD